VHEVHLEHGGDGLLLGDVDGLADAVPGILVMTAPTLLAAGVPGYTDRTWGPDPAWDQKLGGGAMLGIAESIGLPFLFAVLIGWVRADAAEARAVDAELDAREPALQQAQAAASEPARDRPWWETEPRFRDQYR